MADKVLERLLKEVPDITEALGNLPPSPEERLTKMHADAAFAIYGVYHAIIAAGGISVTKENAQKIYDRVNEKGHGHPSGVIEAIYDAFREENPAVYGAVLTTFKRYMETPIGELDIIGHASTFGLSPAWHMDVPSELERHIKDYEESRRKIIKDTASNPFILHEPDPAWYVGEFTWETLIPDSKKREGLAGNIRDIVVTLGQNLDVCHEGLMSSLSSSGIGTRRR